MAILKDLRVDIPPKSFIQNKDNNKYVYIYTNFYRNNDKKARNHSLCIGKQIPNTNMMNPNNNYYSYFNIKKDFTDYQIYKVGYSYLVEQCFNETGLNNV